MSDLMLFLVIALGIAVVVIIFLGWVTFSQTKESSHFYRRRQDLVDTLDKTIRMIGKDSIKSENGVLTGKDYDGQMYVYHNHKWSLVYEINGKLMEVL
jgi:biopolymer transport protein ExbB/TolQ